MKYNLIVLIKNAVEQWANCQKIKAVYRILSEILNNSDALSVSDE